ncbi:hypothetical protein V6N12_045614 [Hibiscus sabdariffa]|uniref:Uncharacterized protein n=1 Tax=Hibiscus sabdariffa TaxID=183260 RepID=A0ABR2G393_9ROSI
MRWYDPPMTPRATLILNELLKKLYALESGHHPPYYHNRRSLALPCRMLALRWIGFSMFLIGRFCLEGYLDLGATLKAALDLDEPYVDRKLLNN